MSKQILYSAETALAYSVGAYWRGLANNGMTDEERLLLDPSSQEFMLRYVDSRGEPWTCDTDDDHSVNGSKTQVAGWSTYTLLLWVIKAAMCTFYLRLTACCLSLIKKQPSANIRPGWTRVQDENLRRLRPHLLHMGCGLPVHHVQLHPISQELADLPRPRQYVAQASATAPD